MILLQWALAQLIIFMFSQRRRNLLSRIALNIMPIRSSINCRLHSFSLRNMPPKGVSLSIGIKLQRFMIPAELKAVIPFISQLLTDMAIWFHSYRAITEVWDQVCVRPDWVLFCRTEVKCLAWKKVITMYMLREKGHFIQ